MKKLLYVEDNEDNVYMLKLRLERKGYIVSVAGNGLDAIEMVKKDRPDLIIMDVGLPLLDGHQATKLLKGNEQTKDIPIIILTAHALVTDAEKAKEVGADDFETKPVNAAKLLQKIEMLLN